MNIRGENILTKFELIKELLKFRDMKLHIKYQNSKYSNSYNQKELVKEYMDILKNQDKLSDEEYEGISNALKCSYNLKKFSPLFEYDWRE
jgi:hypothetical protein